MDNGRTLKVIDKFEILIDYCFPEDVEPIKNQKWKACIPHYRVAMKKLRQKRDFTDDDISEFQKSFDLFYQIYIGEYGSRGTTNYLHLLSPRHMSDSLRKWRNLYIHSQQGWE
jgi:hypothetical protein